MVKIKCIKNRNNSFGTFLNGSLYDVPDYVADQLLLVPTVFIVAEGVDAEDLKTLTKENLISRVRVLEAENAYLKKQIEKPNLSSEAPSAKAEKTEETTIPSGAVLDSIEDT